MPKPDGSKTQGNLKEAFAGESQANRRYLYFAQKADVEGYPDNLKSAIAGETYEYTEMYPGFAKTARDEGFDEVAEWLETLARAEKSHAGRFTQGLESVS
jgi:rubrerythrin